jgi:ribosome assembly protein YihI (activator of Der GTPase)
MGKIKFKTRGYDYVKEVIESYEDDEMLNDFLNEFKVGEDIVYKDYLDFCYNYIDDLSEIMFIECNWNDEYDYI